jgi:hypothetical protein
MVFIVIKSFLFHPQRSQWQAMTRMGSSAALKGFFVARA